MKLEENEKIVIERKEVPFPGFDDFQKYCEEIIPLVKSYMGHEYDNVRIILDNTIPTYKDTTIMGSYRYCSGDITIYLGAICRIKKTNSARLLEFTATLIHELVHSNRTCQKRYSTIFSSYEGYIDAKELDCRIQTLRIFSEFIKTSALSSRPMMINKKAIKFYMLDLYSDMIKWYMIVNEYDDVKDIGVDLDDSIAKSLNQVIDSIRNLDIFRNVPEFGWGIRYLSDKPFVKRKVIKKKDDEE